MSIIYSNSLAKNSFKYGCLSEAGYDDEKLESMKDLIDAKESDVYDVLAFVAYARETQTRLERVNRAKPSISNAFSDSNQQDFIDSILSKRPLN